MKVKKVIMNNWKILKDHGDIDKIVESSISEKKPKGISRVTIGHALKTGFMSETTYEVINKFYSARQLKFNQDEAEAQRQKQLSEADND